jgi:hypothetical protein
MLWTDEYIDSLDRGGQLAALGVAYNCLRQVEAIAQKRNQLEAQIGAVQKKAQEMETGPKKTILLACAAIFLVLLSVVFGIDRAFIIVVLLAVAYILLDKFKLSIDRKNKAQEFRGQNLPQLYQARESAQRDFQSVCSSEDARNAKLLLPDNYLSSAKIQALMGLLQSRRARTISDAMSIYETNEHHRRVEALNEEQLRAAQVAAAAQKQAAASAARTEAAVKQQGRKLDQLKTEQEQRDRRTQELLVAAHEQNSGPKIKGGTMTCFSCGMAIPKKANVCPYCRRHQSRSPMDVLLGRESELDRL